MQTLTKAKYHSFHNIVNFFLLKNFSVIRTPTWSQ